MERGMFISFEGPEGAGKTTQIKLLEEILIKSGYEVILTREPGGTDISTQIRKILLDCANTAMTPRTELLLYASARSQHVEELILPSIKAGKIVLCDRFADSTVAYQGYGRQLDSELIQELVRIATNGLKPDLTFLVDLTPEVGMKRVVKRGSADSGGEKDRLELEKMDFHHRMRDGFLEIAKQEPQRFRVIDGNREIEPIHNDIMNIIRETVKIAS